MCILSVLIFIIFFFKQKTAYEMRISDWSSDVCSSDLDFDPLLLAADVDRGDNAAPALLQLLDLGGGEDLHALLLELLAGEGGDLFVLEIGRASGRERVCQYV